VVLLGLVAWQAHWTLGLFGVEDAWPRLLDDQPILSGRHPLHLYHGYLGAQALRERGTPSCYDPAFQAGYPKTPVFDSGSRPAELFLSLAGGAYRPAAYKVGLAVCCVAVPLFLAAAAHAAGLGGGGACLATAFGLLVWWGRPCRLLLEAGDLDLLLAGLAAVAEAGFLVHFHRAPGVGGWLLLAGTSLLGWFAHPPLFAGLLPLLLIYYVSVGARHRLGWHLALLAGLLVGVPGNLFWLTDWVTYWWIRAPLELTEPLLPHRTFHTFWASPLWGDAADRALALGLLGLAPVGALVWNRCRQRPAARLLGLGALEFLTLALAGVAWEPLGKIGTAWLLVPALWFAALPAAHAVVQGFCLAGRLTGGRWRGAALAAAVLGLAAVAAVDTVLPLATRGAAPEPLTIGMGGEREGLLGRLVEYTTPEARILWEDNPEPREAPRWTALLPLCTGRAFLGGLDADSCIEHSFASLTADALAGRPLADWADVELEEFSRRYNVGWVACASPAVVARFRAWPGARLVAELPGKPPRSLFELPARSFVLKGRARLVEADARRITLTDVVPEDGKVVLSLHYEAGLRVAPGRVQLARDPDARDPIPFVRLLLPGPVARLTLTWEDR
jgi:hypothetical protein